MILLTERNKTLSEIYGRLLSNSGYDVVVKQSMEDAVAFIESNGHEIEFLLLSSKIPDVSERLLVEKTRKKFSDCRILLAVDEITEEVRSFISDNNVDACLARPFLPSDMLKRLSFFSE